MNGTVPSLPKSWAGRRIVIALKAAVFSWVAFLALLALMLGFNWMFQPSSFANGTNPWVGFLLIAAGSAFVVFVVCLVVLIPVLLLIPERSVLWEPRVLGLIGAIAGPLICLVCAFYNLAQNPTIQPRFNYIVGGLFFPGVPSAIIGGITGLVAARLHSWAFKE